MTWKQRATPIEGGKIGGWRSRAMPAASEEREPSTSADQAALEHYGNAATLGYLPHLQAGAAALMPDPSADVDEQLREQGFTISEPDDNYLTRRDENIRRLELESEEHPVASGAGTALGIAATALVPGSAAARGASLGQKAVQGAKAGLAMGAAANPGDMEGVVDPIQAGDRAINAGVGAALGAGLPAVIGGASSASEKVTDYLRNKAAQKATRALGRPTPTVATQMAKSGQDVALGRELLDEGAIPVLGTPSRIAGRVEKLKEKAGEEIGNLVDQAGDAKIVDAEKVALDILESPELEQMRRTPGMEGTVAAIEKQVNTLFQNGQLTAKEAQALRQGIDRSINFNKAAPDMRGAMDGLYKQRTAIRDAMNEGINDLPDAPVKDALLTANRRYGNLAKASEIGEREAGRTQANDAISLKDLLMAGAAGDLGLVKQIVVGGASKAGRAVGNSVQARVYDAISKRLAAANRGGGALGRALERAGSADAGRVLGNVATTGTTEALRPDLQADPNPILNDPRLMEIFRKDPSLVDVIEDEETKRKVRRRISSE